MAVVRPIQANSMKGTGGLYLANTTSIAMGSGRALVGMSNDRKTLWASSNPSGGPYKLQQSVDEGVTWTDVKTFSETVLGVLELDNGEAMVATQTTGTVKGKLYRSTGWSASRTAATWSLVMTGVGGYFHPAWSLHRWSHSGQYMVVNEYGVQANAGGELDSDHATRAYFSTDYGLTWTQIIDLYTRYPNVYPLHLHASAYDPAWDRIWLTFGDNQSGTISTNKVQILYSDDHGATWTAVDAPPDWKGTSAFQCTSIAILDNGVFTMPDGIPYGVQIQRRKGYRQLGPITIASQWAGGTGAQGISQAVYQAKGLNAAPVLVATQGNGSQIPATIQASHDGGFTWNELFRDSVASGTIKYAVGPTASGKVVWHMVGGSLYKADLMTLDSNNGETGGAVAVVDGGTIAHGLGIIPSRKTIAASVVGRQIAITAVDATNLTIALKDSSGTAISTPETVHWTAAV